MLKRRKWTHVSAEHFDPKTVSDFLDFYRIFQWSVQELKLTVKVWNKRNGQRNFDTSDLQFP